jgi:hypothetical protein
VAYVCRLLAMMSVAVSAGARTGALDALVEDGAVTHAGETTDGFPGAHATRTHASDAAADHLIL